MIELSHKELIEKAKVFLKNRGFSEKEIFEEYEISDDKVIFKVDVAGITKDKSVAINCGAINQHKRFGELKGFFDEVIYFPFIVKNGGKICCGFCGYIWTPRVKKPKECPKCKRYNFIGERQVVLV
jgi:hypothetical protein